MLVTNNSFGGLSFQGSQKLGLYGKEIYINCTWKFNIKKNITNVDSISRKNYRSFRVIKWCNTNNSWIKRKHLF